MFLHNLYKRLGNYNKRKTGAWLLAGLLLTGASCRNVSSVAAAPGSGVDQRPIVCLGDSITSGYSITIPDKDDKGKAYPAVLQKKVKVPVINAGIPGDTTQDALYRLNRDVLSKNPQVVVVFLGINDFLQDVDFWFTEYNYTNILSNLTENGRKIYMVRFFPDTVLRWTLTQKGLDRDSQDYHIALYDELFESLKNIFNAEIIDGLWNGLWGTHTVDGLHPDAEGHEILGDRIFKALEPYLASQDLIK
jgi:lysophospholipase L1-like esterase